MPPDLERELHELAPRPSGTVDVDRLWERGIRLRRGRRMMLIAVAASAIVVLGAGVTAIDLNRDQPSRDLAIAPTATNTSSDHGDLEALEQRLASQRRSIREQRQALRKTRAELHRLLTTVRDAEKQRLIERDLVRLDERRDDLDLLMRELNQQLRTLRTRAGDRCPFPRWRPTYLPWGNGTRVPPPRRSYDHSIDRAQLVWTNPGDPDDSVALTVYPLNSAAAREKPIGVRLAGTEGYLHRGSEGENSAYWNLDERCNFLELSVSVDELSSNEVDDEVVKVARSLR